MTRQPGHKAYHDMGGDPAGTIMPDRPDDPIFAAPWHKRVLGLTVAAGAMGAWSIDTSRFRRETLPQKDYQRFSYYEKWLAALTNLFVIHGFVSPDEIRHGYDGGLQPMRKEVLRAPDVAAMLAKGTKASRQATGLAKFSIGEQVRTKRPEDTLHQTPGHTRLPYYAAEKTGRILFHHGHHVLPNSHAHALGELPEPLYSVEFRSADLWPDHDGNAGDTVIVDCWESYLDAIS